MGQYRIWGKGNFMEAVGNGIIWGLHYLTQQGYVSEPCVLYYWFNNPIRALFHYDAIWVNSMQTHIYHQHSQYHRTHNVSAKAN